jgi:hypothetical protein
MRPPFEQSLITKGSSLALFSVYHDRVAHHFSSSNRFIIRLATICVYTVDLPIYLPIYLPISHYPNQIKLPTVRAIATSATHRNPLSWVFMRLRSSGSGSAGWRWV